MVILLRLLVRGEERYAASPPPASVDILTAVDMAHPAHRRRPRRAETPVACCAPLRARALGGPLGLSQPTVSHHLRKLTDAGLLEREQRGRWAFFSLRSDAVEKLAAVADLTGRVAAPVATASRARAGSEGGGA